MGEIKMHTKFSQKTWRKGPLGRPRYSWEYDIRIDLREVGCDDVDCIHLAEDRDQWQAVVNSNGTSGSIKGGEFVA
jgi:hypothetical protein